MTALAEGWQKSESLPAIERDLMLEELRGLYDELLDFKGDSGLAERVGATIMADTATEPIFDDVLDIDALLGLSDVERDEPKQEEVAVEPEVEVEPEPEIEVEVEPEPETEPMSSPSLLQSQSLRLHLRAMAVCSIWRIFLCVLARHAR